jgi:hypothetical protein
MCRRYLPAVLIVALACAGCVSSTLALYVRPDRSADAVITSHLFAADIEAAGKLFAGPAATPPQNLGALLPRATQRMLDTAFGTPVHLISSADEDTPDGFTRTTKLAIDDITHVRLLFPPSFIMPDNAAMGIVGVDAPPVFSFSVRPHEDGNEQLVIEMPAPQVSGDPNGPMTTIPPGSREEMLLKQAIAGMKLALTVETERPLLRTNAKVWSGDRATIVSLDLDRMINAMDEGIAARMMMATSFQDLLWELGDLPGAVIPTERQVFLEYEPLQRRFVRPIPQAPAAPAPPDTEIYLASFSQDASGVHIGAPVNITNNPGYDNQPFFTPDGRAILFTSMRDGKQTDVYRYTLATKQIDQVTHTPESEYSPTITPAGMLSVVRVELDGHSTQRLWQFKPDGSDPRVVLEKVTRVGYHAWVDDHTLALFVLGVGGAPATLELADTHGSQPVHRVAADIGRSIQRIPRTGPVTYISFVERKRVSDFTYWIVNQLDPRNGDVQPLAPPLKADSSDMDTAWTADGMMLLTSRGADLLGWSRGERDWKPVASLERLGLRRVSRIAISPDGKWIALVADPQSSH